MGTGFLAPLLQSPWCACFCSRRGRLCLLCATARCVSPSTLLHFWSNFVESLSWWSGGPSQWWVSLTIRCLVALLVLFLPVQGSLVYGLATAEPVQGTPFHLWTRSCASVADAPVLVWACPLIPDGVPVWPSVLLWKQLQDAGWGALVAPRPSAYSTDRPASVTPVTGHCCVSSLYSSCYSPGC